MKNKIMDKISEVWNDIKDLFDNSMSMGVKTERRLVFSVLLLIFVGILFLSITQSQIDNMIDDQKNLVNDLKVEMSDFYVDRYFKQARWVAESYRKGIKNRVRGGEYQLFKKDIKGDKIYRSYAPVGEDYLGNQLYNGERIAYDPETMDRFERHDNHYDIYEGDELILEKARPVWDRGQLEELFNQLGVTFLRMGGRTSDPIILDPITGELVLDNSEDCATIPQVVRHDKDENFMYRDIKLDHLHSNASYPDAMEWAVDNQLTWRRDGKNIYYFSVKDGRIPMDDVMTMESLNFKKYPLGEYKREFQYQVIIPSEVLGFKETNAQLTLIIGMQEPELVDGSEQIEETITEIKKNIKTLKIYSITIPRMIVLLSIIALIVASFGLRNAYARYLICEK